MYKLLSQFGKALKHMFNLQGEITSPKYEYQ